MNDTRNKNYRRPTDWEGRSTSFLKAVNDFLVDIMGAIIPGFLALFSFTVAIVVPIILILNVYYRRSLSISNDLFPSFFSLGALILILILSYVIGHVFYRSDINDPDKRSIEKKMYAHIDSICGEYANECKKAENGTTVTDTNAVDYRLAQMQMDDSFKEQVDQFRKVLEKAGCGEEDVPSEITLFKDIKAFFNGGGERYKTLKDYLDFIDILSDCVDVEIDNRLALVEELSRPNDNSEPAQEQKDVLMNSLRNLTAALRVFFRQARYIDYCDNYGEFQYVLSIIGAVEKQLDVNKLEEALMMYRTHVLVDSGVKESFFKDYARPVQKSVSKQFKKVLKTIGKQGGQENKQNLAIKIQSLCNDLITYAAIRKVQNEEGTPHKDAGAFPYINYENYMMSRNLHHLAETINWNYREGRTKNQINRYKIKIQLFCPDEAYGVLNKNESHVRMASSTWFASRFLQKLNMAICLVLSVIVLSIVHPPVWYYLLAIYPLVFFIYLLLRNVFNRKHTNSRLRYLFYSLAYTIIPVVVLAVLIVTSTATDFPLVIAPFCPILANGLLFVLEDSIENFIHYQRLREIYFVIYTYHECRDIIRYKERFYSDILKG